MAWNSLQREKGGRGETKRRGGANEALLNKPPKTTRDKSWPAIYSNIRSLNEKQRTWISVFAETLGGVG